MEKTDKEGKIILPDYKDKLFLILAVVFGKLYDKSIYGHLFASNPDLVSTKSALPHCLRRFLLPLDEIALHQRHLELGSYMISHIRVGYVTNSLSLLYDDCASIAVTKAPKRPPFINHSQNIYFNPTQFSQEQAIQEYCRRQQNLEQPQDTVCSLFSQKCEEASIDSVYSTTMEGVRELSQKLILSALLIGLQSVKIDGLWQQTQSLFDISPEEEQKLERTIVYITSGQRSSFKNLVIAKSFAASDTVDKDSELILYTR